MYASGESNGPKPMIGNATALRADADSFSKIWRLVSGSGIVFVDLELPAHSFSGTLCRYVVDDRVPGKTVLVPVVEDNRAGYSDLHPVTLQSLRSDEAIYVSGYRALERALDCWLPLPYFRYLGRDPAGDAKYDEGPTNWVRLFIVRPQGELRLASSFRAVLAIDTRLHATSRLDPEPYLAPSTDDAAFGSVFQLVTQPTALAGFVGHAWIDAWLRRMEDGSPGTDRTFSPGDCETTAIGKLEPIARYLTLMRALETSGAFGALRFADMIASNVRDHAAALDLILDIDDDESTALLVETGHRRPASAMAGIEPLALRELSRPAVINLGTFPSVAEFERPSFGDAMASRRSGRPDAFQWPSLVRVGREGLRLSLRAGAAHGLTGLANLRSAVDDMAPRSAVWRFGRETGQGNGAGPVVAGELMSHLAEDGTVIGRSGSLLSPGIRPRFSASSLVAQFVGELILHALSQINAPGRRSDGAVRYLQRVIITCPVSTTAAERERLQARVDSGI